MRKDYLDDVGLKPGKVGNFKNCHVLTIIDGLCCEVYGKGIVSH